MHRLNPGEIGARQLAEHLYADIGNEPMPEIGDRDGCDVIGRRPNEGHEDNSGGDQVDHLHALADEHVIRGPLDKEGNGAGGDTREDHGHPGQNEKTEAWSQMLPPDAKHDLGGRIVFDLKRVGAAADHSCASKYVSQENPPFLSHGRKAADPPQPF